MKKKAVAALTFEIQVEFDYDGLSDLDDRARDALREHVLGEYGFVHWHCSIDDIKIEDA